MHSWFADPLTLCSIWVNANFTLLVIVFAVCICINFNFNIFIVGVIYLTPLTPLGLTEANAPHFLMVSFQNMVFGSIELIIFAITVKKHDIKFNKDYIKQLLGHTLPIAIALMGLSFLGRASTSPMNFSEVLYIASIFLAGSILRVLAVCQIGVTAFKFDIVFREKQRLKTSQLYRIVRHPSYLAMMIVIFSYAINAHNMLVGGFALIIGWFGFQYRIVFEERALEARFGEDYRHYKMVTGMWFPKFCSRIATDGEGREGGKL